MFELINLKTKGVINNEISTDLYGANIVATPVLIGTITGTMILVCGRYSRGTPTSQPKKHICI
ncbi:hypothetical protein [uncultured Lutibacter sp.]|uniref:hypothetical protein n=1 Tax=uncultured Lutibacter sp. TaxID=437739 RepID=UPI00263237C3|nr:hypothetical protein [uncultured Lutibacter sp.]